MRSLLAAVVVAALASGCVSKSKYAQLETQLDTCRDKLERRSQAPAREQQRELMAQLQPLVDRGVLAVEDEGGRTAIGMRAEVLFPSGSAQLSEQGRRTILDVARILARRTDLYWQVEGHTDDQPIGTSEFPDNWALGSARALSVLRVMLDGGMSPERVSAASFGEFSPVASNASAGGRQQNRRIEIVLLPEVRAKRLRK